MNEPEKLAEQVLILRCQIGDRAAFAELIERYGRALRYFINRLLDDGETAEEGARQQGKMDHPTLG